MIRSEDDLRAMYDEQAGSITPSPQLLATLERLGTPSDLPVVRRESLSGADDRWPPSRRLFTKTVAVAVAVAAVAVALVILRPPEPASADPEQVLRRAGQLQASMPTITPRPDQFYYGRRGSAEFWISVDGIHDGGSAHDGGPIESIPGCKHGSKLAEGNYQGKRPQPCEPDPFYLPDLPTTATAMGAYLTKRYGLGGSNGIGKGAATS